MATPPAGSSLLFGALADSGRIKQRKNGSYRMVLKGVDEIDWFTDRPDRFAGEWSPKKLVKKWDGLFGDVEPNAQATFEMGSKRKLVTFEMFKPKLSDSNQTLSFKVRGIGLKNKDLLTGLKNKRLSDASLFIDDGTTRDSDDGTTGDSDDGTTGDSDDGTTGDSDDGTTGDSTAMMQVWNDSGFMMNMRSSSSNAVFGNPSNVSGYTDAELDEGSISFTGGEEGAEGVFDTQVTLKNGLQTPPIEVVIRQQCDDETTTVYYTINSGITQSVDATCGGFAGGADETDEDEMVAPISEVAL